MLAEIRRLGGDEVENARILLRDRLPFLRRVALTEQPLEQLARIGFHRQRRRRRPEGDGVAVAASEGAVARVPVAAAALGRHFERRQRRVLAEVRGGELIHGDAAVRLLALARQHAAQPGPRTERVHGRRDRPLVLQSADHRQLFLERRERLEDRRQLEVRPFGHRRPLIHDRAVRQIHEPHARLGTGGRLGQSGPRRDHRVQQRQAHGDAGAAEERAAGEVFLGDEHHWLLL